MQGLQDLEQLGHEDWRFALIQQMSGIFYHKSDRAGGSEITRANIRTVLIDPREPTVHYFAANVLAALSAKIEINRYFNASLVGEDDCIVDMDLTFASLLRTAKAQIKG